MQIDSLFPSGQVWHFKAPSFARVDEDHQERDEEQVKRFTDICQSIKESSLDAYTTLVKHFDKGSRVWLLGQGDGTAIIRCVLGMVAVCGVIEQRGNDEERLREKCEEVFHIYQSPSPHQKPGGGFSLVFRLGSSHLVNSPLVTFVGLVEDKNKDATPEDHELCEEEGSLEAKTICQTFSDETKSRYRVAEGSVPDSKWQSLDIAPPLDWLIEQIRTRTSL